MKNRREYDEVIDESRLYKIVRNVKVRRFIDIHFKILMIIWGVLSIIEMCSTIFISSIIDFYIFAIVVLVLKVVCIIGFIAKRNKYNDISFAYILMLVGLALNYMLYTDHYYTIKFRLM